MPVPALQISPRGLSDALLRFRDRNMAGGFAPLVNGSVISLACRRDSVTCHQASDDEQLPFGIDLDENGFVSIDFFVELNLNTKDSHFNPQNAK
jgi:hypothetical protein